MLRKTDRRACGGQIALPVGDEHKEEQFENDDFGIEDDIVHRARTRVRRVRGERALVDDRSIGPARFVPATSISEWLFGSR